LARYLYRASRDFARTHLRSDERPPVVVSAVIPDEAACSNFAEFCIPSLEDGLKSLNSVRTVSFLVFARISCLPRIRRCLEERKLGCAIVFQEIPEMLAARAERRVDVELEWLTGALQGLHLTEAKRSGADFYSVNPNAVYADAFLEGVLRLEESGKAAVLLAALPANRSAIRRELARFRCGRTLSCSPIELISIGLRTLVLASRTTAQGRGESFGCKVLRGQVIWEGKDRLEIHTTRHEVAFLARAVLEKLPNRLFMKLSTDVDEIMPDGILPHFVCEADNIAMLDLGGPGAGICSQYADDAHLDQLPSDVTRVSQIDYFRQPIFLAISRSICGKRSWQEEAAIVEERGIIFKRVGNAAVKPLGATQALKVMHTLHKYELSEYGLDNLARVIAEGHRVLDVAGCTEDAVDEFSRIHLIRASMNFDYVDNAIALAKCGRTKTAFTHEFLVEMMNLKAVNILVARELRRNHPDAAFSLIGSIVWGQLFVEKFMSYCVPTLLAEGNIPALARKGKVVHSIVTTHADRDIIAAHPAFARLSELADVVFTCFPAEFLTQREAEQYNFYHFYGFLDHHSVFLAESLHADLYLLPVDCVYSQKSLSNLSRHLEAHADACSVAAIEADEMKLLQWLDAQVKVTPHVLDISGAKLLQAAYDRSDRYFRSQILSPGNTAFCRHPRELVWPVVDGLSIRSIFMHPVAVSARMLSRPFHPHHENVDFALLPRLLQNDGKLKVIEDASEVAIGHFGAPAAREEYLDRGFSLEAFAEVHRFDYVVHRRCFASQQLFPVKEPLHAPSVDYAAEVALIQAALVRYRFRADPG